MIEFIKFDVILGIEIWLSICNKICIVEVCFLEFGYDVIYRDREGDVYWGVVILVKIYFSLNYFFISKDFEFILGCIIISFCKKLIMLCFYCLFNR